MKRSSATRKIHRVVKDGRVDYVDIEHFGRGSSSILKKSMRVRLNNFETHDGRHGCDAPTYTFRPGSVRTVFPNRSEAIVDDTHIFLVSADFVNKRRNGCRLVNTGGTIVDSRKDAHDDPAGEWAGSIAAGLQGREVALSVARFAGPDGQEDPALHPGEWVDWSSADIWEGFDLSEPVNMTSVDGWSAGVF